MDRAALAIALIALALLTTPARAADWPELARAQFGTIDHLGVRDGYVVWSERKLDEATRKHRAQSFWRRIYRLKLDGGGAAVETLSAPQRALTRHPPHLLGGGGAVAWAEGAGEIHISRPGQPPRLLPGRHQDQTRDAPIQVYADALLCRTRWRVTDGLALVPLRGGVPAPAERRIVVDWRDMEEQKLELRGDAFVGNGYVAFMQKPQQQNNRTDTVLYSLADSKTMWTTPGWPIALDARFLYVAPKNPFYPLQEIRKLPLDADRPIAEDIRLPWRAEHIVDLVPPKLLVIRRGPATMIASELDLGTNGSRDLLTMPTGESRFTAARSGDHRMTETINLSIGKRGYLIAADAATADLIIVMNDVIYRVPAAPR